MFDKNQHVIVKFTVSCDEIAAENYTTRCVLDYTLFYRNYTVIDI